MKIIFTEGVLIENQQSVLDTIQIRYDSFFEQEKKIASYILQNYKDVINMTIGELADASGASVATVSRFCKKCDVDGFHHLKIGLAKELVMGDSEVHVSNDISRKEQTLDEKENRKEEEKTEYADYVADENVKDGIYKTCSKFGWF